MSHPFFNPLSSGKLSFHQVNYGPSSGLMQRDPHRPCPDLVPGSSFSFYGASSTSSINFEPAIPQQLVLPLSYRPEQSGTKSNEDIEGILGLNIGGAREDVRHHPVGQDATTERVPLYSSSAASNFLSTGHGRIRSTIGRKCDVQLISDVGDEEMPMQDKSVGHTESNQPNYTPESAANILQSFGLEKEDLEDLLSYPEDQVTPDNLPFILRQIRIQKDRSAATAVQSIQSDETGKTSRANSCGSGGMLESGAYSADSFRREPTQKSTAHDQLGSEVSRSLPVKETECPGLVPSGSDDHTCNKGQSKTCGQRSKKMKKQPTKQLHAQQKAKRNTLLKHREQPQKQSESQKRKTLRPRVLSKPVSPSLIPTTVSEPAVSAKVFKATHVPPTGRQFPAEVAVSKGLPTLANIHDYAAATPRVFPHTCSLCNKRCALMKVWLSHQNTNLHLDNCKLLRKKYPGWDGEVRQFLSALGKNAKISYPTRARTSQRHHQKTKHESPSGSQSPRRRSLEGRRHKTYSRSRSRSPLRSWDTSTSSSRPRSHSPRCLRSDRRERRSSRSPRTHRSQSRSPSPWYDQPTSSRNRAHSTSRERQLSSGRRDEKQSSPRGSCERWSSPSRSDKEKSPSRRGGEKLSPPGKSRAQRKRLNSVKRLAKRVMQAPAVQSLSNSSDLQTVVKTLAPALLAELAKMKSASVPSSSKAAKLESTKKSLKAKPSLQKSKARSSARLEFDVTSA
ncbi:uncharacterized protein [Leuresthes tenuis]|uniref:uncharacterized protein n=1 Tax=Leuresthes tenuis TaxID=355514 RepID=UPI003B501BA7